MEKSQSKADFAYSRIVGNIGKELVRGLLEAVGYSVFPFGYESYFTHLKDRAQGEERKRLVEKLIRELPKLDPFDGMDEFTIWLAKLVTRVKWVDVGEFL